MNENEAEELLRGCSVYGVIAVLRALREHDEGLNVSQLARETKLHSPPQVRKYLRLTMTVRMVRSSMGFLQGNKSVPVILYNLTDEGREFVGWFDTADMIKPGFKRSIAETLKKRQSGKLKP